MSAKLGELGLCDWEAFCEGRRGVPRFGDNGQEACDSGQEDNGKRARGHGLVQKLAGDQFADHVADCLIPLDGAYARARQEPRW